MMRSNLIASCSRLLGQPIEAAKFAAVGIINTLLDLGIFTGAVTLAGWTPTHANLLSYSCGMINSFLLNREWTFRSHAPSHLGRQFAAFATVNLAGLGLSTMVIWTTLPAIGVVAAKGLAILATFLWNYLLSRQLIFRTQEG